MGTPGRLLGRTALACTPRPRGGQRQAPQPTDRPPIPYRAARLPEQGPARFHPPTAYVQNALTRLRRKRCQSAPTKRSELQFQLFADLSPRADPYFVLGQRERQAILVHAEMIA